MPPDAGGAFGSVAFPGLGVLAAEGLFDVAEADLDGPAAGVAGGHVGAGGGTIGGDEEVVGFDPVGSRTMTRRTRSVLLTAYQRTSRTWTSRCTGRPRMSMVTLAHWFGRTVSAIRVGWAAGRPWCAVARVCRWAGPSLVEGGVAADPGGQVGSGQVGAGQAGVGAVGAQVKRALG